ncbi:hypothetical protein [Streptomyces sp. NPDC016845]|uniref:hypothetical protein n=1 Tax=Streptomyces sp. NPDC016845 TaxID=3364972 RepID=UPI00378EA562
MSTCSTAPNAPHDELYVPVLTELQCAAAAIRQGHHGLRRRPAGARGGSSVRPALPASILRAAQFHEFVGQLLDRQPSGIAYIPDLPTQLVACRTGPHARLAGPTFEEWLDARS